MRLIDADALKLYIDKEVEQVFFMSDTEKSFISSSNVKEFFKQGVDISNLVPTGSFDVTVYKANLKGL